eukprot:evm.model.scf_333.1 EVM.evm.TU.scf_333.1   scf_333:20930-23221(+)
MESVDSRLSEARHRMFEKVISHMTTQEKTDPLNRFPNASRDRVARSVGCSRYEVEDCINSFLQLKILAGKVAELKAQGKPIPTSPADLQGAVGEEWDKMMRDRMHESKVQATPAIQVDDGMHGPGMQPCPFANQRVNRNTICPLTKKKFKRCCGSVYSIQT